MVLPFPQCMKKVRLPHLTIWCRYHVKCVYDDSKLSMVDEFRQIRKRLKIFESLLDSELSKSAQPALAFSNLGLVDRSSPSVAHMNLAARLEAIDDLSGAGEEILRTLQTKPGEVYRACQLYFQNVHKWVPIISQKLFYKRLTAFSQTKYSEFALLLLCVFLLTHYPANGGIHEPLYKAIYTIYWRSSATLNASIELIQAGLLMACYEYGSGMTAECHKTIGLCTRMGFWLDLHTEERPLVISDDDDVWAEKAERCNLWWGLVIRDR